MIEKTFGQSHGKPVAHVTFILPDTLWADAVYLVGDFNGWDCTSHPFQRDRDGRWVVSLDLDVGRAFKFRYLRDDMGWVGEMQADAYVPSSLGGENFVVVTDPDFKPFNNSVALRVIRRPERPGESDHRA